MRLRCARRVLRAKDMCKWMRISIEKGVGGEEVERKHLE